MTYNGDIRKIVKKHIYNIVLVQDFKEVWLQNVV